MLVGAFDYPRTFMWGGWVGGGVYKSIGGLFMEPDGLEGYGGLACGAGGGMSEAVFPPGFRRIWTWAVWMFVRVCGRGFHSVNMHCTVIGTRSFSHELLLDDPRGIYGPFRGIM